MYTVIAARIVNSPYLLAYDVTGRQEAGARVMQHGDWESRRPMQSSHPGRDGRRWGRVSVCSEQWSRLNVHRPTTPSQLYIYPSSLSDADRCFCLRLRARWHVSYVWKCSHWRSQLWGTGPRAPLDFQQYIFFRFTLKLHKLWQRLCVVASPNIFVFCDSSCGSSVAATWTLFSVIIYVTIFWQIIFI